MIEKLEKNENYYIDNFGYKISNGESYPNRKEMFEKINEIIDFLNRLGSDK